MDAHIQLISSKLDPRWAFNLGCSTRFSSQTPSLKTWRAKVWAKKSETMKSRPHPYFWTWKIKVQKIKPSVSGVCRKLNMKMAQEMNTAVLSVCSLKKTLNYKISTLPQRTVNHTLFIPPSVCVCQSFSPDAFLACKYLETLSPSSLGVSEVVRILICQSSQTTTTSINPISIE